MNRDATHPDKELQHAPPCLCDANRPTQPGTVVEYAGVGGGLTSSHAAGRQREFFRGQSLGF